MMRRRGVEGGVEVGLLHYGKEAQDTKWTHTA